MKTTYVVQSFKEEKKGERTIIVANTPLQFNTSQEALSRAERDAERFAGVIAISQEYDEGSDEFGRMEVLFQAGSVPEGVLGD